MGIRFSLEQTPVSRAISWYREGSFRFLKTFRILFLFLFGTSLLIASAGLFFSFLSHEEVMKVFGVSFLAFPFLVAVSLAERFFNSYLSVPRPPTSLPKALRDIEEYNLAEFLTFESALITEKAREFADERAGGRMDSLALLYGIFSVESSLDFIFQRIGVSKNLLAEKVEEITKEEDFAESSTGVPFPAVVKDAFENAERKNHALVESSDLLLAAASHDLFFQRVLLDLHLKVSDLETVVWWLENAHRERHEARNFWSWENLLKKGSIARSWTAGYTPMLDKFSTDLTEIVKKRKIQRHIGHRDEIKAMERILTKQTINNVLLVGEPGSGRRSTVFALTERIAFGKSLPNLNYKRVVLLNMPSVTALAESTEELESLLDRIFGEVARAGNIILVLDEFHQCMEHEQAPGTVNVSGILYPYLSSSNFQLIGVTSHEGLHQNIEKNPSIVNLFERVETTEVSSEETLLILQYVAIAFEQKNPVFITFQALVSVVEHAKYLPASAMPEKAIRLLDEVVSYAVQAKEKVVLPEHVTKIVRELTKIPAGELEEKEKETLLHLEELLGERIVGQKEAVERVASSLRRARSGVRTRKGPIGSFLFLGPTGVGKTETAKSLARVYFGSESRIIRLDMSEFQNTGDIPKLLGGGKEQETFITKVRESPFSLVLLDEIEKSHPNILNLFLQVLDEGHLTDGMGRRVDFTNTIIIATSNAGANIILRSIKESVDWDTVKEKIMEYVFGQGIFRPEFVNRFDAVVLYKPLSQENLLAIAELRLRELQEKLEGKGITFSVTPELKEKVAELGYNPSFGARYMRRVIQRKIEDPIARGLLSGMIAKGMEISVDPESFEVKVGKE